MADLRPREAGIRAQAVLRDGTLVHDFLIEQTTSLGSRAQRAVAGGDIGIADCGSHCRASIVGRHVMGLGEWHPAAVASSGVGAESVKDASGRWPGCTGTPWGDPSSPADT